MASASTALGREKGRTKRRLSPWPECSILSPGGGTLKTSNRTILTSTLCALLGAFTSGRAFADVIQWNNPAGGDFSAASNWDPNQIPGSAAEALSGAASTHSGGV